MKGFIEVPWPNYHGRENPRLIKIDHIVEVFTSREQTYIVTSVDGPETDPLGTDLSYAEVKKLIEEAQK